MNTVAMFGKPIHETNEIPMYSFHMGAILFRQFKNPLLLIFLISTIISFVLGQKTEAYIIWIIMTISITLGFWNEWQAEKTTQDLMRRISYTATIIRNGIEEVLPIRDIRLHDIIVLMPGVIVPADIRLSTVEHLEVNESVLTGESLPMEKKVQDYCYMGSIVTNGKAQGDVIAIGKQTKFGKIASDIQHVRPETEFQKGLRDFSVMLTKIAALTVVLIILLNWLLGHSMIETILFALTIAMGITPELLPLIVTISLSYGARRLAKESVIIKQLVSVEDVGNMDILCTDKTGTLTEGNISLHSYVDATGTTNEHLLTLGLLCNNAVIHKHVYGDAIDTAIWEHAHKYSFTPDRTYKKMLSAPFDFEKRILTTLIRKGQTYELVIKGSPDSVISQCTMKPKEKAALLTSITHMQEEGLRVICLATKQTQTTDTLSTDEKNFAYAGLIAFADIPKKDVRETLEHFKNLHVQVKILTGDSDIVTRKICDDVGFSYKKTILGTHIDAMDDTTLEKEAAATDIFARVTPIQKARIIQALKHGNHTVGFLGDGINDGPGLRTADIGISVNSGVDVAKDAASIVLIHKNLSVITKGIREGRRTFQNTIKYVLMGTSSDFGNMISAAAASVFLPFLPMTPVQVLLTDILYDISQLSIPSDTVDSDQLLKPKRWDIGYIRRFMFFFGPISSLYDMLTFALMYFFFHARGNFFQTGWFIESLLTEVLVVFVIRTKKSPFYRSKPGKLLILTCGTVIATALILPYSGLGSYFQLVPLPPIFFLFLMVLIVTYLFFVELGKRYVNKKQFESDTPLIRPIV